MKTKLFKISLLILAMTVLYSCNDEQLEPTDDQEIVDQTKAIAITKNITDKMSFGLFGNSFRNNDGGRLASGKHRFSGLFRNKEEAGRVANIWNSCAFVTITENPNGTFTVILNFGEGCEENGKFIKGVVAFTGAETDSSGFFQIAFSKFAEYDLNNLPDDPHTVNGVYRGGWVLNPNENLDYAEGFEGAFEVNFESGAQVKLAGNGELAGNQDGVVVAKHNCVGSNSNGDKYASSVVKPLIFSFNCPDSYIYVAGTEVYHYNGKSAAVDYGNGACDNILSIQQKGIIIIIDLDTVDRG